MYDHDNLSRLDDNDSHTKAAPKTARGGGAGNSAAKRYAGVDPIQKKTPTFGQIVDGALAPGRNHGGSNQKNTPDMFGGVLGKNALAPGVKRKGGRAPVDKDGFACAPADNGSKPGCFLPYHVRAEHVRITGEKLKGMVWAFGQAMDNVERSKMQKGSGNAIWKMLITVAFGVATRGLGSAALGLLNKLKPIQIRAPNAFTAPTIIGASRVGVHAPDISAEAAANAVRREFITTTLGGLGMVARTKALALTGAPQSNRDFPTYAQEQAAAWGAQASKELKGLTDLQLLSLRAYLETANLDSDITYYKGKIEKLLGRHKQQVLSIGKLGPTRQVVRITKGGKARLAVCRLPQSATQRFQLDEDRARRETPDTYAYHFDKEGDPRQPPPGLHENPNHFTKTGVWSGRWNNARRRRNAAKGSRKQTGFFVRWIDDDMASLALKRQSAIGKVISVNMDPKQAGDFAGLYAEGRTIRGVP